jgi:hypothetical protein
MLLPPPRQCAEWSGFRLIYLLCQSYPPHCVVLRLELSEWLWKKSQIFSPNPHPRDSNISEQGERGYQALLIDTNERNLRSNSAARG